MIVAAIFTAMVFDFEPTKSFALRKVAQKVATMLGKLIEANVKPVTATSFASNFIDGFRENHHAASRLYVPSLEFSIHFAGMGTMHYHIANLSSQTVPT